MSLRNEGAQEIEFLSVSKSLKKIIEIKESGASALTSVKFGGKITTVCTRYWNDFSYNTSKDIEIWTDGNKKDILLNECLFSYLVKGYEGRTNSRGYAHGLTIQGCWPNDEEFSFDFTLSSQMEELISIIYAIIILSETRSIDKSKMIWKIIKKDYCSANPAERLNLIIEGEDFSRRVLEKYPFMTSAFKSGLEFQIEKAKEEISSLQFLK